MLSKFSPWLFVIGAALYAAWTWFAICIIVAFVVMVIAIAMVIYNRRSDGKLWKRNKAGRGRESRMITFGILAGVIGAFLVASGRRETGAIGAALLVFTFLALVVFPTTVGHK